MLSKQLYGLKPRPSGRKERRASAVKPKLSMSRVREGCKPLPDLNLLRPEGRRHCCSSENFAGALMDCLFCNIATGKVAAHIIYQDNTVLAFDDIHPQAPHHKIIIH